MSNTIIDKLGDFLDRKIRESDEKWRQQQSALIEEAIIRDECLHEVLLKPHIAVILSDNLYFGGKHIHMEIKCHYVKSDNSWKVVITTRTPENLTVIRPHVLTSLNKSAADYFMEQKLNCKEDYGQLQMLEVTMTYDPVSIQLGYQQLYQKYEILQHKLFFTDIRYVPDSDRQMVQLLLTFQ